MIPDKVRQVLQRHGLQALEFEPGNTPRAELADLKAETAFLANQDWALKAKAINVNHGR